MECKLAKQPTDTGFYIYGFLSQPKERTQAGLNLGSIYDVVLSPPCPILVGSQGETVLHILMFPGPASPGPPLSMLPMEDKASAILFRPVLQCRSSQQSVETIACANLSAQILTHK